jgi:DNA-binding NarL/FixJ family response regulator
MIRVIVAQDHHLLRQGIRALLERAHDIEIVAEAAHGQKAVELVEQLAPDVLVLDIAMPWRRNCCWPSGLLIGATSISAQALPDLLWLTS